MSAGSIKNFHMMSNANVEGLEVNPKHLMKIINEQKKVMHQILQEKLNL